jgi:hypothetical protein
VLTRIHHAAILVERPERIPEQTSRIILLLERDEALPVLTERGNHASGNLVPSEELRITPLQMRFLYVRHEKKAYRGEGATARHLLYRLSKPLFHSTGEKGK